MAKEVPQFVKFSLRSVLLSNRKGTKQTSIEKDYHKLTNTELDFRKYGYQDLFEFLLAIPDVARLEYSPKDGENKVFGVGEKGIYMSVHAKKAEGIPNGLKPLHPSEWPRNKASKERTVVENRASLKVTVHSDSKKKISPNASGLYALHIKNLPPDCQQSDINCIFKKFLSLAEVKLESSLSNGAAFVRFSSHADAVKALSEMDGFNLKGFSLIINPATERLSKVSKDDTELAKKKEKAADSKSTLENKELTSVNSIKSTSPLTKCQPSTVVPAEKWDSDTGPRIPKAQADGEAFFSQEEFAGRVFKMNNGYPIHVSNFPAGTNQKMLKQLFSGCGEIVHIQIKEKFAFIYFSKKEAAITALMTMTNKVKLGGLYLTITPRTPKGQAKQQINVPVASSAVSHCSSQNSLSSISSSGSKSSVNCSISHSVGLGSGDLDCCLRNVDTSDGTCSTGDLEKKGYCAGMSEAPIAEERKKDGQTIKTCNSIQSLLSNDGHSPPNAELSSSDNLKERFPLRLILTHQEMQILATKCNKPLRTMSSFGFEEFDILVTDVVDSCHFWANVDDKSGSYKQLQKIEEELKTVEHFKQCMPVKCQLGAALYSEDDKWYRCWCLEVTAIRKKEAKVFFVDYGNCEWISWDQFTDIDNKFWDLAPQAVPFKLAGLKHAPNLAPGILNEGSKYLSALICNEVCRARKTKPQDSSEPHIIEVELIRRDGTNVNEQMALTRYVHKTGTPTQTAVQNPYVHQSSPLLSHLQPSSQPEKHIPPHPFMKTQTAQATQSVSQPVQAAQSVSQPVQRLTSQDYLPDNKSTKFSQRVFESTKPQSAQGLFQSSQGGQAKGVQQTVQNATEDPVAKSPRGLFQDQQSLPNQLFKKQEVIEVFLSSVESLDELGFFLADQKTKNTLLEIRERLRNVADPKAAGCKIYPRIGDVVLKVHESRRFRVKIVSIPANAGNGIDKVKIKDIDHGKVETVPLSSLSKLPASAREIPPQAIQARLAGIRKKQGMLIYPDAAVNCLVAIKRKREVLQASIIKREPNGLLHVELFEPSPSRPSLNVQLVKMGYAEIDPSQCSLVTSDAALPGPSGSVSKSLETQRFESQAPSDGQTPGWQKPGLVERKLDVHQWDTHSVHSDWEDNLIEIQEDWDDAASSGSHAAAAVHVSKEELYVPPPPDVTALSLVESARSAKSCVPSATDLTNSVLSSSTERLTNRFHRGTGPSYSSDTPNSELCDICLPDAVGLADPGCYVSLDVRTPSPTTGSDSSGVYSEGSLNGLSTTESSVNREDRSLLDRTVLQQCVETNLAQKDWRQERGELVQRDEELKRLLEMPRQDMKKMISLRQEKEKLERKIRIKGLENQILKLQKELKNLEMDKAELETEVNQ